MARVAEHVDDLGVESPYLLEGLPGVGLVGKIATDHLVSQWDMRHVASCYSEGIPEVAVYGEGEYDVRPPVRVYADADRNVLALQSDVPVSPESATEFATCVTEWLDARDVTPVYLTGLPTGEKGDVSALYGIATGAGGGLLREHDISPPPESGLVSGPTGALVAEANEQGLDSVGLIVESNPQFPDPEAARAVLVNGVGPITDHEIDTDQLVDQAEEIAHAKETLAQRMQQESEESSAARPVGMYQ